MAKWTIPEEKNVNDVEETKEQKVNAMLAIRKMVKDHISGKNKGNVPYLAKLDLTPADTTRMIVALQDLVDDERGRRLRAQGHIVKLIDVKEQLMDKCIDISEASLEQSQRLSHATQTIIGLNEQASRQEGRIVELQAMVDVLRRMVHDANNRPSGRPMMGSMGECNQAGPNLEYRV